MQLTVHASSQRRSCAMWCSDVSVKRLHIIWVFSRLEGAETTFRPSLRNSK